MPRELRIKGGAKNYKSGQKWTRPELLRVLDLFITNENLKIHESNKLIQDLASELGRTTRSVEAQLLMFRNLYKFGFYGYGNMNALCKLLWHEYIDKTISNDGK